jgi:hypothetical protein
MMFTQVFEDAGPVQAISEQIASVVPGTVFVDRGTRRYDEMRLEDLDHR